MFFYQGLSCPHCLKPFNETDDIVACPICGAPHHRDCWIENGGCACAEAHGTDAQWSRDTAAQAASTPTAETPAREDAVFCPHCHAENSPFAECCSRCGSPLQAKEWHTQAPPPPHYHSSATGFHEYTPFHVSQMPCGGVQPDAVLEGETAKDLSAVVNTNVPYYLPRFERMARSGSKVSWNWAAFLFPPFWLLFRKQYLAGIGVLLLDIAYLVINTLLGVACFPTALEKPTHAAMVEELMFLMNTDERAALALYIIAVLWFLLFCVRVAVALFGNRLYMKHCLRTVRTTREAYPEGYHAQLAMVGGTSFALAMVGIMCYTLLPELILMLIL